MRLTAVGRPCSGTCSDYIGRHYLIVGTAGIDRSGWRDNLAAVAVVAAAYSHDFGTSAPRAGDTSGSSVAAGSGHWVARYSRNSPGLTARWHSDLDMAGCS